jgi:DNA primase
VPRYTPESKDRVRDAVDMHALVSERTDLRRVGTQWMGRCPFHDERTASLSVDVDKKVFNCFGCGEKGDVFDFVEKTQGLDFVQALEWLADRTGVELEQVAENPEEARRYAERRRLWALLDRAAKFYSAYLWKAAEAEPAREYLKSRGLVEAVLREFQIGYAPAAGDRLIRQAAKSGSDAVDLVAAGLARRREGRIEDTFRGRIIFPLADQRGRVLGFAGRALREGQNPKYLNTSENRAVGFHKGQLLYGMHAARAAAMKAQRFVVVEGYTDVLALRQAGIVEAVAIMGTSLTEHQLQELTRAQGTVYLALDADNAGKQATSRAAQMSRDRGSELRVVAMPGGRDPAEIVTEDGAAAFHALLEEAVTVPEFHVRRVLDQADRTTAEGSDRALADAAAVIRDVKQPHMRQHLIDFAARNLGVEPDVVRLAVGPMGSDARGARDARVAPAPPIRPVAAAARAEQVFLSLCLSLGELGREYLERSGPEHFGTAVMRDAWQHLLVHTGDPLSGLSQDREDVASAVMEIVQMADEGPVAAEQALRLSWLELERRRLDRDLLTAEQVRDFDRQRELWGERERIRGEINELMGQTA